MDTFLVGVAGAAALGVFVSGYLMRALPPGCPGFWTRYAQVSFMLFAAFMASIAEGPRQQLRMTLLGVFVACVWLGLVAYDQRRHLEHVR